MGRWWKTSAWRSNGQRPVEFYGRVGGNVPSVEELLTKIEELVPAAV
jgi:hypothetical protein